MNDIILKIDDISSRSGCVYASLELILDAIEREKAGSIRDGRATYTSGVIIPAFNGTLSTLAEQINEIDELVSKAYEQQNRDIDTRTQETTA